MLLGVCLVINSFKVYASDDWDYSFELYGMGSSISGNTSIGRVEGAPVDVSFGDILENLDMAAMVHFEAFNGDWGMILDYGFMDLSSKGLGRRGILDARVRQGVAEALLAKKFESGGRVFDVFAGVRWWDNDIDLIIDPVVLPGSSTLGVDEDWVDLVVGMRGFVPLSEKWMMTFRGDLGGLDISSSFTASAAVGGQYRMSNSWILNLQYKGLWVDYKRGDSGTRDSFRYDTLTHGPIVGIIHTF